MIIWQNDSLDFFACQTVQRLDKDQKTMRISYFQ